MADTKHAGPCTVEQIPDTRKMFAVMLHGETIGLWREQISAVARAEEFNDFWRKAGGPELLEVAERTAAAHDEGTLLGQLARETIAKATYTKGTPCLENRSCNS